MKKTTRINRRHKNEKEWMKVLGAIAAISGDPKNQMKESSRRINNARK